MRWVDWGLSLRGLKYWLSTYEVVDLDFDVRVKGIGTVGTVRLGNVY